MGNRERLLDIIFRDRLSHIGSCLSMLPILEEVYAQKKHRDRVVLDAGHAHLAHAVILESMGGMDAEVSFLKNGIHCDRSVGCDASTGSLGQGLPISVGFALADRNRDVWCLVTDGSLAEGSNWEAMNLAERLKLDNLHIIANINGWSAYDKIDTKRLTSRLADYDLDIRIRHTNSDLGTFAIGQMAHYATLTPEQYEQLRTIE